MNEALYAVPCVGLNGYKTEIRVIMSEDQYAEMSAIGKFQIRVDHAAEILAILDADQAVIAGVELEGFKMCGGVVQ